jgi:hypothetical protein
MITTKIDITNEIAEAINNKLTEEIEKEFDKHIKELEERKNEIVAGILLNIKKTVSIDTMRENITFTIREITK